MKAWGRGKIVNICSLQSELGRATIAPYAASKGGLKMLTRGMTVDWARFGIQINGIGAGYLATEMTRPVKEDPDFDAWICGRTPAGRWGDPQELIGALLFFCSAAFDFVNGQLLLVDGGITAAIEMTREPRLGTMRTRTTMKTKSANQPESQTDDITQLILEAKEKAYRETDHEPEPSLTSAIDWPIDCNVGPGLEGAIACESKIGYVNGSKGWLIYRGYDIFDLCAWSNFEEVTFLLLHGTLPSAKQLVAFKSSLHERLFIPETQRLLLSFPVQDMNPMAALRLGTNLMRQKQTVRDKRELDALGEPIASDEDSIAMETRPKGDKRPVYEFFSRLFGKDSESLPTELLGSDEISSCYNLIAGIASIAATIGRVRAGRLPLEPLPDLGLAGNYLYMLTGRRPTPTEVRIMDICLILHADHGMNASTFASMVVASTLSDIYLAIGSGISALAGPLHGGANVEVIKTLEEIGSPEAVSKWYERATAQKQKIMGFGHRVYKAYDPRARILGPLAKKLAAGSDHSSQLVRTAVALEEMVVSTLGEKKKIFPNVDFYSGLVYRSMGIPTDLYTTIFAVSRVSGWCARVVEYLEDNRIFRPRAIYTGTFNETYVPVDER